MTRDLNRMSLRTAALIAFIAYLLMMASPFAEFKVYQKLIVPDDAALTVKNVLANKRLFTLGIFAYLVNFMGDILAAWALYILMRPVNHYLSLLTAWIRLIYTILSLGALSNLGRALDILNMHGHSTAFNSDQIDMQVMLAFQAFRRDWSFAFIFFGIHLIMLGYLAFRSWYVSKVVAICLIIAGAGWLIDNLQPYLYPEIRVSIGMFTGFGELVFMIWLIVKGIRIKDMKDELDFAYQD